MLKRKYFIAIILIISLTVFLLKLWANPGEDQAFVLNAPIDAVLNAGNDQVAIKGMFSLHLETSFEKIKQGNINLKGFDLFFSNVPQKAISGYPAAAENASLVIQIRPQEEISWEYRDNKIHAIIPIRAYYPQIDSFFPPEAMKEDETNDNLISEMQNGDLEISIDIDPLFSQPMSFAQISSSMAALSTVAEINIDPLEKNNTKARGYKITSRNLEFSSKMATPGGETVVKKFCVQPISIKNDSDDPNPTGINSLEKQRQSLNDLWGAFGIVIDVKEWLTIYTPKGSSNGDRPNWKIIGEKNAKEILTRLEVEFQRPDLGNCIGVIFAENFDPLNEGGGGWTVRGGKRIFTSDGNVAQKDYTNLAHELGHAFGLDHPKGGHPPLQPASEGTIMCPSGWGEEAINPYYNSLRNIKLIKNGASEVVETTLTEQEYLCVPNGRTRRCTTCK